MGFQPEQCAKLCCLFIEDFEPPKCSVSGPGNPCDVCLQVSEMDVQIARARSLLADLGSKRKQLKMKLNSRHDQIARYLPVEVASHIFTFYVHGTDGTQPSYKTASSAKRGVPLVLAAVCKAWRRIIFASPQLWTTMSIDLSIARDPALQVELATQWLRRSGNMPLSITVDAPPNDGSQRPDRHTGALFEILKTYAFRWKQLALSIPNKFYSAFTEGLDDVPLLESLSLMRTWDDTELQLYDELADVFALNVAPCFKNLAISSIELNLLQMQIDSLTSLWFNNVTVDEIFEILSHATQLIKCEFYRIQGNTNSFPFPDAPVVHSSLKSLSISPEDKNGATPEELSHLFDLLELPSLKYFSHISTNSKHPMAVMSLSSLFTRSHSPLEHLSITVTDTGVASSESEIISLLENLPTITHFAISSPHDIPTMITDIFFKRLAMAPSAKDDGFLPDIFLPHLEVFNFTGPRAFSWQSFANIFLSPASEQHSNTAQSTPFASKSIPSSSFLTTTGHPTRRALRHCNFKIKCSQFAGFGEPIQDKDIVVALVGIQKTGNVIVNVVAQNRAGEDRDEIERALNLFGLKRENI